MTEPLPPIPSAFDPTGPRFARPASAHGDGALVAFCDGHVQFVRKDIDYIVYQGMLTSNRRKCVDPRAWNNPDVNTFRNAPPLTENDYQ